MTFRKPSHITKDFWTETLKELKQSGRTDRVTQKQVETLAELLQLSSGSFSQMSTDGMTSTNSNGNTGPSAAFSCYMKAVALRHKLMLTLGKPTKGNSSDDSEVHV